VYVALLVTLHHRDYSGRSTAHGDEVLKSPVERRIAASRRPLDVVDDGQRRPGRQDRGHNHYRKG